MTIDEIKDICWDYNIDHYTINDDMTIDVNQDVDLSFISLDEIPLNFNNVNGDFNCRGNDLTSLKGSPVYVTGYYNCYKNNLTSLKYSPRSIGGEFSCSHNKLETLDYCPNYVGRNFQCNNNKLKSLKGIPDKIFSILFCDDNNLTSFKDGPKYINGSLHIGDNNIKSLNFCPEVNGIIDLRYNKIFEIWNLFNKDEYIEYFNELDIIQEDGDVVILDRLNYFLTDIGRKEVSKDFIKNYIVK